MSCAFVACYFVPTEDSNAENGGSMSHAVVSVGNDCGCGLGNRETKQFPKDDEAAKV
jgi:hypothetical protein